MSYILDALKKAEAERRREQVPGLDAQPVPVTPSSQRRPAWLWPALIGGAATLALLAGLMWWQLWRAAPPAPAAPVLPPVAAAAPATPQAPAATEPPKTPAAEVPKAPAPVAEAPPRPAKPARQKAKPAPEKKSREPEAAPPEAAPPKTAQSAPATAPAEESISALRDLPEAVQRTIPPISVGGYIYAAMPADRSVLINKRLVREGEQVGPDLTLEKMTPNGMVFNYKGTRFRTSY